jgi:hypothetical protein
MTTVGVESTEVFVDGVPDGYLAECPICHRMNRAGYDAKGQIVWYPNGDIGTWCEHATGCYEGRNTPIFLF